MISLSGQFDSRKFYVYAYLNPLEPGLFTAASHSFDYRPFYIGKGTGSRLEDHLREAEGVLPVTNENKAMMIVDLIEHGTVPYVVKVEENLTHQEALSLERSLIADFGIADDGGLLTNISRGDAPGTWNSDLIKFVYLMLSNENDRLRERTIHLESDIQRLPHGSIQMKQRRNRDYCYLAYREGDKVKFKYIGKPGSTEEERVKSQIEKRGRFEADLRSALRELHDVERLLYLIELGLQTDRPDLAGDGKGNAETSQERQE